jgi:hypothetical protein
MEINPGPILLFDSGEPSPAGRKVFDGVLQQFPDSPRIGLLETPAGFEPNSARNEIATRGWQVMDTNEGPVLNPV